MQNPLISEPSLRWERVISRVGLGTHRLNCSGVANTIQPQELLADLVSCLLDEILQLDGLTKTRDVYTQLSTLNSSILLVY